MKEPDLNSIIKILCDPPRCWGTLSMRYPGGRFVMGKRKREPWWLVSCGRVNEESTTIFASAVVCGIILLCGAIIIWGNSGWGRLDYSRVMRLVIPGATVTALGVQTILFSFFMSILGLKRK